MICPRDILQGGQKGKVAEVRSKKREMVWAVLFGSSGKAQELR